MEETAILDAEAHGMGIWKMVQNGYTSVISRLKLRINYIPRWGEKLHVSTWTKSIYNHKVALRDYSIRDDNGNMIAEATSSWLIVNLQTGHSEDPEQTPFLPTLYPEKVAISENLMLLEPRAKSTCGDGKNRSVFGYRYESACEQLPLCRLGLGRALSGSVDEG